MHRLFALVVLSVTVMGCKPKAKAPGYEERLPDGGALLEFDVECGKPIWVDGVRWTADSGVALPVAPGEHHVACGDAPDAGPAVDITVHDGTKFHFIFWGLGY